MKLTIMSKYLKDHLDQLLHGQLHSWRRALPRVRRDFSRAAIHSPGIPARIEPSDPHVADPGVVRCSLYGRDSTRASRSRRNY